MVGRNRDLFSTMIIVYLSEFLLQLFVISSLCELVSHSCFMHVNRSPCSYEILLQVYFCCVQELFKFPDTGIKTCFLMLARIGVVD